MSLGFLSIPYSHLDLNVIEQRINIAERCQAYFLKRNCHLISPAIYGHHLHSKNLIDNSVNTWRSHFINVARGCDSIYILLLDGWKDSTGIFEESILFPIEKHNFIIPNGNTFDLRSYDESINRFNPLYSDLTTPFLEYLTFDVDYLSKKRRSMLIDHINSKESIINGLPEKLISNVFYH